MTESLPSRDMGLLTPALRVTLFSGVGKGLITEAKECYEE
jgi:hypothetical protein